jgi:lysyl-tRNA synthetase class I
MILKEVIAYVESNNNPFALRYEESYFTKAEKKENEKILNLIQAFNRCSKDTAKVIFAMSFGLYQILGVNLYSICELKYSVGEFLCYKDLQDTAFFTFCKKRDIDLEKVENELRLISEKTNELERLKINELEYFEKIKEFIEANFTDLQNLVKFVQRYNGAIFQSVNFFNYLYKMINAYKKLIKS